MNLKPDMVVQTYNRSTWVVEAEESGGAQGHHLLHSELNDLSPYLKTPKQLQQKTTFDNLVLIKY